VERYVLAFLVAIVLGLLIVPVVIFILRKGEHFDRPNERSSHTIPTPRGAGVAQMLGMAGALSATGGLPLSGLVALSGFSVLGAADDLRPRPPLTRLILQFAIALAAVAVAVNTKSMVTISILFIGLIAALILVWVVNATNFMDGINGISVAHGIIFGFAYGVLLWRADLPEWATLGIALAGVSFAVLPWNWGRSARVFLGDSGSYLLGASAAIMLLATWLLGPGFAVAVAPLTIYLADTGFTLFRRAWRHQSLTLAHRDHVYQQLIRAGWSHPRTALFVAGFSIMASLSAIALQQRAISMTWAIAILAVLICGYLISPRIATRSNR
jgi:UDP-N-acetylmuramyl pentapeptide phosphotransferase/UDP-N-acetylglucosamine-1-phosphate transferase